MKPNDQDNDLLRGRRILQILEKEGTKLDRESKFSSEEIQEISKVLELSGPRRELRLPENQIEQIAGAITKTAAAIRPLRKPTFSRRLGFGLLAAAVFVIVLFQLYEPRQSTSLDWEATEFQTISQEIGLASVLLAEGAWLEESQSSVLFPQKTENALLDAQLQLSDLENSLSDSLFILNQ